MVTFDIIIGKLIYEEINKEKKEVTAPERSTISDSVRSSISDICKDCKHDRNTKVLLKCNDTICKDCMTKILLKEFSEGRSYQHKIFCKRCKRIEKIGILLSNN